MAPPKYVFLDTSVFDAFQYNFETRSVKSFVERAQPRDVVLLMPRPTLDELARHIADRVEAARVFIKRIGDEAPPFARLWSRSPPRLRGEPLKAVAADLQKAATKELDAFLSALNVVHLAPDGVSLTEILDWSRDRKAPFSTAKPKEFPDAVAFAILRDYAQREGASVAVVSLDGDFKKACELHVPVKGALTYFASLEELLEPFLEHERRFASARALLPTLKARLEQEVDSEFENLWFDYAHAHDAEIHNAYATAVGASDVAIVDVDDDGFDVTFHAHIKFSASIVIPDWDTALGDSEDGYHPWRKFRGTVKDETNLTGAVRVLVDESWTTVLDIEDFGFDETHVTVRSHPDDGDDDDREEDEEEDLGPGPRH